VTPNVPGRDTHVIVLGCVSFSFRTIITTGNS